MIRLLRTNGRTRSAFPQLTIPISAAVILWGLLAPLTAQATTFSALSVQPGASAWMQDSAIFSNGFGKAAFTVPAVAARPLRLSVHFRGSSSANGYRTSVVVAPDGRLTLQSSRLNSSTETLLTTRALSNQVSAGQQITLQGWVTGDSSVVTRARLWVGSAAKPDWQLAHTDSSTSRVTGPGHVRARAHLTSSATASATVPVTLTGDAEATNTNLSAQALPKATKLTADRVGVPSGTPLTVHQGDLVVSTAGTVVSNRDVRGHIIVRAPNVKITKTIVRGGAEPRYHLGLITSTGQSGLVVEDVDLKQEHPSVKVDGILGDNFTLRRVHVRGGVDNVKIQGDNVRVENSLLEGLNHFASDPSQNGGPTHNDNVQILKGRNITIAGTTALATNNFAILGAAEWGAVSNLMIANNYVDGGHCTVKLAVRNGYSLSASVQGNVFGPHRIVSGCALLVENAVTLSQANNVLEVGGTPVTAKRI